MKRGLWANDSGEEYTFAKLCTRGSLVTSKRMKCAECTRRLNRLPGPPPDGLQGASERRDAYYIYYWFYIDYSYMHSYIAYRDYCNAEAYIVINTDEWR